MSVKSLEQRVAALEFDVRALKAKRQTQLFSKQNPNPNWVEEVAGSMRDFPEFDDVLKSGTEFSCKSGVSNNNDADHRRGTSCL